MGEPSPRAYSYRYPRPAVSVDLVLYGIIDNRLHLLLVQRANDPFRGQWAFPGGFVDIGESLLAAATRELYEETSLTAVHLEQLRTFGDPDRDPRGRVITVAYAGVLCEEAMAAVKAGDDASAAAWFDVDHLPALAFDHRKICAYGAIWLQDTVLHSGLVSALLPKEFTLFELQRTYEIIMGTKLDKRNFRRKVLSSGTLEATGGKRYGDHRPARLYHYICAEIDLKYSRSPYF